MNNKINHDDVQSKIEVEILKKFAHYHPNKLLLKTIKKVQEPKPDIEIRTNDGHVLAFELSEIVDPKVRRRSGTAENIEKICNECYQNLPTDKKNVFDKKYGNCLIKIFFNEVSYAQQKKSINPIIDSLLDLDDFSDEKDFTPSGKGINSTVKEICLRKGSYSGPIFDANSGGFIEDNPIRECIEKKFKTSYQTDYPIELLLYYDYQPETSYSEALDVAKAYLSTEFISSQFQRVWIYSCWSDTVVDKFEK